MTKRFSKAIVLLSALFFTSSAFAKSGKRVVVLVAMPGAGKSAIAERLSKKLAAPRFSSGDVIRQTIKDRGLPYNAENDKAVSSELAQKPGAIGRSLAAQVEKQTGDVVIVEGFRATTELEAFKSELPNTTVVAVDVGAKRRYARMLERGRDGEDNIQFLKERDARETKRGVRDVMKQADIHIRPGEGEAALDRSVDNLAKKIAEKPAN